MARIISLDAGVIGLACCSPLDPGVPECKEWFSRMASKGNVIVISDVTDYEVRRELERLNATAKLRRLDALREGYLTVEVSSAAWAKAAEFWAIVRKTGKPTAHPMALDADAILAGVAFTLADSNTQVTIATTNVGHLDRFPGIEARKWQDIN